MSSSPSPTGNRAVALRRARPTTARGPRYGVGLSLLFHGAILAAALVTFNRNLATPEESHSVPVDLVTIAEKTNVAAQAPPAPPLPKVEIPTPAPSPPSEPHLRDVEPAPVPPVPQFKVQKDETPKDDQKVTRDDTKSDKDNFAALLNKLTTPEKPVKNARVGPRAIQGIGSANMMTADLSDALKSQIYKCWSPPVGAPNANDLVVEFDLNLNQDGTVARVAMAASSQVAAAANPFTRAAAEAASRAIYQCQPYRLPPDRYAQWREISPLRFDPRQMMEQ